MSDERATGSLALHPGKPGKWPPRSQRLKRRALGDVGSLDQSRIRWFQGVAAFVLVSGGAAIWYAVGQKPASSSAWTLLLLVAGGYWAVMAAAVWIAEVGQQVYLLLRLTEHATTGLLERGRRQELAQLLWAYRAYRLEARSVYRPGVGSVMVSLVTVLVPVGLAVLAPKHVYASPETLAVAFVFFVAAVGLGIGVAVLQCAGQWIELEYWDRVWWHIRLDGETDSDDNARTSGTSNS